ncbi:MAG TPA: zf-HC2 domain-containing protein, partial [Planctomycetota bacterium]|nr:zf-HC2 domain-containing protein [Planctomycetota bacterium]
MKRDTKNNPECVEAEIWLSVKVDGERVPELKAALLERHLAACPSCRRAIDLEARRTDLLRGALARGRELSGARLVDSLREAREAHTAAPRPVW